MADNLLILTTTPESTSGNTYEWFKTEGPEQEIFGEGDYPMFGVLPDGTTEIIVDKNGLHADVCVLILFDEEKLSDCFLDFLVKELDENSPVYCIFHRSYPSSHVQQKKQLLKRCSGRPGEIYFALDSHTTGYVLGDGIEEIAAMALSKGAFNIDTVSTIVTKIIDSSNFQSKSDINFIRQKIEDGYKNL
jgi:hypothetical protein